MTPLAVLLATCVITLAALPSMRDLMDKLGTDKGARHHYYRQYDRLFAPLRLAPVRVLEIGVSKGYSMSLWPSYFANAEYVGGIGFVHGTGSFDVGGVPSQWKHKVHYFNGDQSDVKFLDKVMRQSRGKFDIIIDDGSHVPRHQFVSMSRLLRRDALVDGGLYIVEDVEASYWPSGSTIYGYPIVGAGLKGRCSFVERTKHFVDVINRRFVGSSASYSTMPNAVDHRIESVEYSQNLIVLRTAMPPSEALMGATHYKPASVGREYDNTPVVPPNWDVDCWADLNGTETSTI